MKKIVKWLKNNDLEIVVTGWLMFIVTVCVAVQIFLVVTNCQ